MDDQPSLALAAQIVALLTLPTVVIVDHRSPALDTVSDHVAPGIWPRHVHALDHIRVPTSCARHYFTEFLVLASTIGTRIISGKVPSASNTHFHRTPLLPISGSLTLAGTAQIGLVVSHPEVIVITDRMATIHTTGFRGRRGHHHILQECEACITFDDEMVTSYTVHYFTEFLFCVTRIPLPRPTLRVANNPLI